ncbi:hypothetical protein [Streptomyces sp. NBC_00648]|uniref:hypothetical protein n=1 Tax=Streptomyces sp. NBC_00648 TaxID=2975797 RepID=UPI002F90AFC4
MESDGSDRGNDSVLARLHTHAGHPLHAGLLAAFSLTGTSTRALAAVRLDDLTPTATALTVPAKPGRPGNQRHSRSWYPVAEVARPPLIAARAWHYHHGHRHSSWPLFQHDNFHHHNQLSEVAAELGITTGLPILTGNPAWPRHDPHPTGLAG